jgi:hypothetical protein
MNVDNALANSTIFWIVDGGDTGRGKVEHRSILQLSVTHNMCKIWVIL